ncbi:hypothetical protein TrispH2_009455 [Trichoplax sp. H2]|nr:hypothetical protein TrispH2_009455 [Trichoplax sp. H2]|eukprot:RDD38852.1 hypothetical protein TrispH2_009455 [Trichoplax sp. H2]
MDGTLLGKDLRSSCCLLATTAVSQIITAIVAYALPCQIGLYAPCLTAQWNTFWVAGPVMLFDLFGFIINKNNNPSIGNPHRLREKDLQANNDN